MRALNALVKRFYELPPPLQRRLIEDYSAVDYRKIGSGEIVLLSGFSLDEALLCIKTLLHEKPTSDSSVMERFWHDTLRMAHIACRYILNGKTSISFRSESTRDMILDTSADKLTFKDLRLPLPFLYVNIEQHLEKEIGVGHAPKRLRYFLDGASIEQRNDFFYLSLLVEMTVDDRAPELISIFTEIQPDDSIASVIEQTIGEIEKMQDAFTPEINDAFAEIDVAALRMGIEYVVGAIAFMNFGADKEGLVELREPKKSVPPDFVPANKKAVQKAVLSSSVYLLSAPKREESEWRAGRRSAGGRKRHLVRGHFRSVAYGPRRGSDGETISADARPHRITWIAPFWKNVENEEAADDRKYII